MRKGLQVGCVLENSGASSFSLGIWLTNFSFSKDSFISKSLFRSHKLIVFDKILEEVLDIYLNLSHTESYPKVTNE